jgi:uncharacterized protein (DUF169 family)
MQEGFKGLFTEKWEHYFPGASLPIVFYYADNEQNAELAAQTHGMHCLIHDLQMVRAGKSLIFDGSSIGCSGGKFYLGFSKELRANFNYFLSCGIPGELEGERYKASPELVEELMKHNPPLKAPGRQIIFKRWDQISEEDQPLVVIFFGTPDILSGLFTLANYEESDPQAVSAPMGSGCFSIVQMPYREAQSSTPRAVIGMFDVSARPWVGANELAFSIPWKKFEQMVNAMGESFLITPSWEKIEARISSEQK